MQLILIECFILISSEWLADLHWFYFRKTSFWSSLVLCGTPCPGLWKLQQSWQLHLLMVEWVIYHLDYLFFSCIYAWPCKQVHCFTNSPFLRGNQEGSHHILTEIRRLCRQCNHTKLSLLNLSKNGTSDGSTI